MTTHLARGTAAPFSADFDLGRLAALRRTVAIGARSHGLRGPALEEFLLAVNEIVSNAVAHGGGRGRLRLWCDEGNRVCCQVSDDGPGLGWQALARPCPPLSAEEGRGLWMARQFCSVSILPSARGTTVEVSILIPGTS
ncbi:MAG: ATP-binding protein [Dactylosporangium sp.]|nr:ATP-binding protein [Dactylosporangium sp.]NNJ62865.1 ATP-binding protein [Dactylosporangium sp.]